MCIRDSSHTGRPRKNARERAEAILREFNIEELAPRFAYWICLLYTSDAADERSSVDLGGRRIIKKKKY